MHRFLVDNRRATLLALALLVVCLCRSSPGAATGAAGDSLAHTDSPVSAGVSPRDGGVPVGLVPFRELGRSGSRPGEFRGPGSLAATPVASGVLVADVGNSRVQHLDLERGPLWEVGGLGTQEGSFRRPTDVAVASSLSYLVLDELGQRVLEFHARGEFIAVPLDFSRPALLDRLGEVRPRGLVVDREGNTIISDHEGDRLLVFSSVWDFMYEVGGFGDDQLSFQDPEGVAFGNERIFVADSNNGRIQVLDRFGGFVDSWELPGKSQPLDVAVDAYGNVFAADVGSDRIVAFSSDGTVTCEFGVHGRGLGSFRRPSGVCVVGEHLVVADADNDRLQVLKIEYGAL